MNYNINVDNTILQNGNLSSYLSSIKQIPVLSAEEERELAIKKDNGCLDSAKTLILSTLRFVHYIANSYSGYNLNKEDLIQEGNIGLLKAVKKYSPSAGVRLASYAVHWIRSEISEYIMNNWSVVKVSTTKSRRALFWKLNKEKKRIDKWLSDIEINNVALKYNATVADVIAVEQAFSRRDDSTDNKCDTIGINDQSLSYLSDDSQNPLQFVEQHDLSLKRRALLEKAISTLNEREKFIIQSRQMVDPPVSFRVLAEKYNISLQRVQQIENIVIKKLSKICNDNKKDFL